MTYKTKLSQKITSLILSLVMMLSVFPFAVFTAFAANSGFNKVADPSTMDGWTSYFYQNANNFDTRNAGGIWTDKTVLTEAGELKTLGIEDPANEDTGFLSVLSAIGSNMTITGESAVATDTVMVLDTSNSMGQTAVEAMVEAANISIKTLMDANVNNRVSIVFYANSTVTFLTLDHYTTDNDDIYLNSMSNGNSISLDEDVLNSIGDHPRTDSREVTGGTYMARGLHQALSVFKNAKSTADTVARKPVIMFMTDGSPTRADTDYTNPPQSGSNDLGNGTSTNERIVFATELAASYVKETVTRQYNKTYGSVGNCLFYTLGMTGGDSSSYRECVLDPVNKNTSAVKDFWNDYAAAAPGGKVVIREENRYQDEISVKKLNADDVALSEKYVDKYFAAATEADLVEAFEKVLTDIALQTTYYPTLISGGDANHSGYISFVDKIGRYMKATAIKGLIINGKLYDGSHMAEAFMNGELGSVTSPTDLGDNLIWSIKQRLSIEADEARALIASAYAAGQLYKDDSGYSNYFGWYSDENNKFLGFYGEGSTVPAGAVYTNKSYLFLGAEDATTGIRESDMMYATIRIREKIETGEHEVDFAIPASLVPTVTYSVNLDANGEVEEITTNAANVSPIRLVYETELDSRINRWTAGEIVDNRYTDYVSDKGNNYTLNDDGSINFYNNKWDFDLKEGYGTYNPYSYFRPSYENDRHYYKKDVVFYVEDAQSASGYKIYEGEKPVVGDGNKYFYGATVYFKTGADSYKKELVFEQLRDEVLPAVDKNAEGNWYIPQDYIRRAYSDHVAPKAENKTETLSYYASPYIDYSKGLANNNQEGHYSIVGSTLGNNGRVTLIPETGVKITKQLKEGTTVEANKEFTFNIATTDTASVSREVYKLDASGNEVAAEALAFNEGKATVKLKAGETIYIGDMKAGDKVTVTEAYDFDYAVETVTVNGAEDSDKIAEVTLDAVDMPSVVFTNAARQKGSVNITKIITHPYGTSFAIPTDKEFKVNLKMTLGEQPLALYDIIDANNPNAQTDEFGIYQVTLTHGASILLSGIPEGTKIVAQEIEIPNGFTASYNDTSDEATDATVTISTTATQLIEITNKYEPDPPTISPTNFTVTAVKSFDQDGVERKWLNGDKFTFTLQKSTDAGWVVIDTFELKVDSENNSDKIGTTEPIEFDFNTVFSQQQYDKPGEYFYHIREEGGVLPGVNYDTRTHRFSVTVSDDKMNGKLQITDVKSYSDDRVVVTHNTTPTESYNLNAIFVNDYNPEDALANIEIHKIVNNPTNSPLATLNGFSFKIAQVNEFTDVVDWTTAPIMGDALNTATSTTGVLKHQITFDAPGTYKYKILEVVDAEKEKIGWIYDKEEKYVTVVVSNNGGVALSAQAYVGTTAPQTPSSTVIVDITNTYKPEDTEIVIIDEPGPGVVRTDFVKKQFIGRDLTSEESKFKFYIFSSTDKVNPVTVGYTKEIKDGEIVDVAFEDNLEFNMVGEYYFSVYEETTVDLKAGVTYDKSVYDFTVTVTDNGEGSLEAVLTVDNGIDGSNEVTFVNTYKAEEIPFSFGGKKELSGKNIIANEFGFYIQQCDENGKLVDGAERTIVYNAEDKTITFPEVTYTEVGVTHYLIWEDIPDGEHLGITYDTSKFIATVTVKDNTETAKLEADVTYKKSNTQDGFDSVDEILFNNSYKAANAIVPVGGTKNTVGIEIESGQYSFELYKSNEQWQEKEEWLLQTVSNGAPTGDFSAAFTFESLSLDNTQNVYYFLIKEKIPEEGSKNKGVTYDETVFHLTVTVTDKGRGQNVAETSIRTAGGVPVDNIVFNNVYAPVEGTSVTFNGLKTLDKGQGTDVNFTDFTFTFGLYKADENFVAEEPALETVDAYDNGKFSFTTSYTPSELGKTYYYVIKEIDNGIGGVTYSQEKYHVTVKVLDTVKDGVLETDVKITDKNGAPVAADKIDFVNNYAIVETTKFSLSGQKNLEGRDRVEGEFKFDVFTADENANITSSIPVKSDTNALDGKFAINDIPLTAAGTHYFVLKEDSSSSVAKAGVTYDGTKYLITVKVKDNKNGKLSIDGIKYEKIIDTTRNTVTENDLVFNNSYKASASDPINIVGKKKLNGRELAEGEFAFLLHTAVDSTFTIDSGITPKRAVNKADKTFEFDALTYTQKGTYYYVISEDATVNAERVTFDDALYYVIVTVTDDTANAKLKASYQIKAAPEAVENTEAIFTNIFTPKPADITVDFNVNKKVENKGSEKITAEGFEFLLEKLGTDSKLKVTTDKDGKAKFTLTFTEDDIGETYNYKLTEVKGDRANVKYSAAEYAIAVSITLGDDNKLIASITKDTVKVDSVEAEFINEYDYTPAPEPEPEDDKPSTSPETGENNGIYLWLIFLFISTGAVITSSIYSKKKKEEN